jgi:GntR family transcriptional regulator
MRVRVDPNSGVPVYRQIVDQIRFEITAGLLAPGDELPSTRALSLELGVNPMTVSKAWGILEEEGFVTRRAGLALSVAPQTEHKATRHRVEELETRLKDAARAAAQLGISPSEAAEIFRRMVSHETKNEEKTT